MNNETFELRTHDAASVTTNTPPALERAADCILDDCLFAMGQVVGMRMAIDYDAVIWIRDRYRAKFLRAMDAFGDRWPSDRDNVASVAFMMGERAVRYAAGHPSIDLEAVKRAAADVERYCQLHSKRRARAQGLDVSSDLPRIAGYWCMS